MTELTATTEIGVQSICGEIREAFRVNRFVRVTIKTGKKRSLSQNDISHAWYEQMARELREDDANGWKCYCKLHHAVPILRAEDAEFRATYDSVIRPLDYERKLAVMKILPVTSLMTKAQLSKYLEEVQADFQARGVWLQFPQESAA
jgi:hypothetical protein